MGIILFNNIPEDLSIVDLEYLGFRPLMGIILFNYYVVGDGYDHDDKYGVSVP